MPGALAVAVNVTDCPSAAGDGLAMIDVVVAVVAMVVFKLGALSVWAQVTSMVLTVLFFAALGWGALAVWRRLTSRT